MKTSPNLKNVHTITVGTHVGDKGTKLEVTIEAGIPVQMVNEVARFSMNVGEGSVTWKNGKNHGTVEDGTLVRAGFYIRNDRGQTWYNIGSPFKDGWPADVELLVKLDRCVQDWRVYSPNGEMHRAELVNFPKKPDDFAGELLVRLPDGCYMKFVSQMGSVCVLNVGGRMVIHHGRKPNINTYDKALRAFRDRAEFLEHVPHQYEEGESLEGSEEGPEARWSEWVKELSQQPRVGVH
jgi:hypothetical protein